MIKDYVKSRSEKAEELDLDTHSGYQDLANAIVAQAYKDLVYALLIGNSDGRSRIRLSNKGGEGYISLMKWFRTDPWYKTLTDVDGEYLIKKAKKEVKLVNECLDTPDPIFTFNKYRDEGNMSMTVTDFKSYLENYRFDKAYPFYQAKLDAENITKTKRFEELAFSYYMHVILIKDIYQKDFFSEKDAVIKKLASNDPKLSVTKLKGLIKIKAKIISYHNSEY